MQNNYKGSKASQIFDYLHEHIIVIIIAVVVLAGAISTFYIIKGDAAPSPEEQTGVKYKEMNTVYFAMSEVGTLNPLSSQDKDVYYISQLMYSSLFRLDEHLNIEKDLVSKYTANPKLGKVEITLRDGLKFSNGQALTAEDVRYTVHQIQKIGSESPYYEYASKIDSVSVSGSRHLTVTFAKPTDAALDNLVFPIVSSGNYSASDFNVVGSGPYRFKSYDKMRALKLVPNKYYYGDKAANKLEFHILPDKSKATGLMTTDFITAYMSTSSDADAEGEDKGLRVESINSGELEYMAFNFKNKHLAQKKVRQAIAKSIDADALIHDNYGGFAVASDSVYFPEFLGTENKGDAYEIDQKSAAQLLTSSGYKDIDEDGILEDKKGKELKLSILVNSGNGSRSDSAYAIADGMKQLGIKTEVKSVSWADYRAEMAAKNFDIYLGGYRFDKKYDLKSLFRKGNIISYRNDNVLSYVNQMEYAQSAEGQKKTYEKLKPLLIEDLPYYPICYKSYGFMTVKNFHADTAPTFFDIYRGCGSWTWKRVVVMEEKKDDAEKSKGR